MESCNDMFEQWRQIQGIVEDIEDACEQHERLWYEDFFSALENLGDPEPFLRNLIKGRKEFDMFLTCKTERDHVVNTEWSEAVNRLRACIEEYGHQESL